MSPAGTRSAGVSTPCDWSHQDDADGGVVGEGHLAGGGEDPDRAGRGVVDDTGLAATELGGDALTIGVWTRAPSMMPRGLPKWPSGSTKTRTTST